MTPGTRPEIRLQTPPRLIGRQPALQALVAALERALAGDVSVVLVSGEPGVGKTRLVRELAAIAERRGAQVCMSRCIEGSTVPYLPFATALLPRLERAGIAVPGDVLHLLHPGAVSSDPTLGENRTPELFFALPRAAFDLAARRPLLLVVDDAQWADPSTLGVLEHLVLGASDESGQREIPLCLVVVHRDVAATSQVARTLSRLRREHLVQTVALPGLDELELNDLLWEAAGGAVAPPLLSALHRATAGNPLFALESLKLLAAQGNLHHGGEYIVSDVDPADLTIHNELTDAIEERGAALPPESADLVTVAALAGDEVPVELLAQLAGVPVEQALELLDEAASEGFVLDTPDGLRFAHPLVRRVFGRRWSPSRRRRMHLRIADALQSATPPASEIDIATHLLAAGSAADPALRGRAAAAAAQRAFALSAWGESARFYTAAIEAPGYSVGLPLAERAALTLRTAQAQYRNLDVAASQETFLRATSLFREARDYMGWAESLVGWMRAQVSHDLSGGARVVESPELQRFFAEAPLSEKIARARVETQVGEALFTYQDANAREYALRGLAVGEETGDAFLAMHASDTLAIATWQALDPQAAIEHHEAAYALAKQIGDPWYEAWPLQRLPLALAAVGRLKEAEAVARKASDLAQQTHDWAEHSLTLACSTALATLRGDYALAEQSAAGSMLMFRRSNYMWSLGIAFPALIQSRLARGEYDAAEHAVSVWASLGAHGPAWLARLLCLAYRGDFDALHAEVAAHPARVNREYPVDMISLGTLCMRVEIAALSSDPSLARGAWDTLQTAAKNGVVCSIPLGAYVVDRMLGDLHALEEDVESAEERYNAAITWARAARARAELAIALFSLAQLLFSQRGPGQRLRAHALLREALALFTDLGMRGWLTRAQDVAEVHGLAVVPPAAQTAPTDDGDLIEQLAHGLSRREIAARLLLGERTVTQRLESLRKRLAIGTAAEAQAYLARTAAPEPRAPRPIRPPARTGDDGALRIVLVSDIVGSTKLNEALGDAQWIELLQQHNRIVREQLSRFAGAEVKQTGDGTFAWFPSASMAISCALAVEAQFPVFHAAGGGGQADVCIGISAGEPVFTENDLIGLAVTQAFRICDRAAPGEVLVSDAVRRLAEGGPFVFRDRGRLALKGFRERTRVHAVAARSDEAHAETA